LNAVNLLHKNVLINKVKTVYSLHMMNCV